MEQNAWESWAEFIQKFNESFKEFTKRLTELLEVALGGAKQFAEIILRYEREARVAIDIWENEGGALGVPERGRYTIPSGSFTRVYRNC